MRHGIHDRDYLCNTIFVPFQLFPWSPNAIYAMQREAVVAK